MDSKNEAGAATIALRATNGLRESLRLVMAGSGLVIQPIRTIETPRVFHPGDEDKAGYWEDFGITTAFDFHPDAGVLVALMEKMSPPTRLFVFDLQSGAARFTPLLVSHRSANIRSLKLSPEGNLAVVPMGADGQIALWNVQTGALVARDMVDGDARDAAFHPLDGSLAVVAGKYVEIWHLEGGRLTRRRSIRAARSASEWPMSVCFSPDGAYLAIGTSESIYICRGAAQSAALQPRTRGANHRVAWNAAGDRLAAVGFGTGGDVSIWKDPKLAVDAPGEAKYELLHTIPPAPGESWGKPTWDPTGQLLAVGGNGQLGIWDAGRGTLLAAAPAHPGSKVLEAHWRGTSLITVGAYPDKNFHLWSVTR
jgi:WD40 repeat protein